jgi:hypothetical protein
VGPFQPNQVLTADALNTALANAAQTNQGDGVVSIDQARAIAGGVTPGDTPGFPVTIDRPGSYRLTSNLINTEAAGANAIAIIVDNVTLDLNGFSILGSDGATFNDGVFASDVSNLTVANGIVHGMVMNGLRLGNNSRVYKVQAIENNGLGIHVGNWSLVSNSIAELNGGGIVAGDGSSVQGNVVQNNKGQGIQSGGGSLISGNAVRANSTIGIGCGGGCTISGNTVSGSAVGMTGIQAGSGALISNNTVSGHTGNGISTGSSAVLGNLISANNGIGLTGDTATGFTNNVIRDCLKTSPEVCW